MRPGIYKAHAYLSIWRAPRPLIMIRFIRAFLKLNMAENSSVTKIFKYVETFPPQLECCGLIKTGPGELQWISLT